MKAKYGNIVNAKRQKLQEVLPLKTPYSLFIDVCNACNFKCKFCAIQYSDRKLSFAKMAMDFGLYKKIIDDLTEFERPLKMLRLAANGEPLMNRHLPEMIRYAKEKGIAEHIEIVTNASLLTPELSRKLVDAGLDRIRISIEAVDADGYYEMCGVRPDWEKFLHNIADFYEARKQCEVYIKTVDAAADTQEKRELFMDTFGDICDKISIEHVIPIWTNYDEIREDFAITKGEGLHGHEIREVNICPFPFYSFVINPDGQVTACCSDWERGIVLGDVTRQRVKEVWDGETCRNFLEGGVKWGRKNNPVCARCVYPLYDAVDNLDPYASELAAKFERKQIKI